VLLENGTEEGSKASAGIAPVASAIDVMFLQFPHQMNWTTKTSSFLMPVRGRPPGPILALH
jgi:hypothetical protein